MKPEHITKAKGHFRYRLYQRFNIRGISANKLQKMAKLALMNATVLRTTQTGKIELKTVFMGQIMKMVYDMDNEIVFTCYK